MIPRERERMQGIDVSSWMDERVKEILERDPELRERYGPAYLAALEERLSLAGHSKTEAATMAAALIRNAVFTQG